MTLAIVLTTIRAPSDCLRELADRSVSSNCLVVVAGDEKSPKHWKLEGVLYLSIDDQGMTAFKTARFVPKNSYARKMMGYLEAAARSIEWIRETDDDNLPYPSFLDRVPDRSVGRTLTGREGFVNVYSAFTDQHIWPRGLPLNAIGVRASLEEELIEVSGLRVFQALADGDPDVDAIYRLTAQEPTDFSFRSEGNVVVPKGKWTPFNSQATTWPRELLPLMYLPSTCSFRMTDIWRSYIAQRLMPGLGATLIFTSPTVYQDRNEHDLMRDFRDEIEGYVGYERFVDVLQATSITGGFESLLEDLRLLYVALVEGGFFTEDELTVLDAWISDMISLGFGATK